MLLAASLISSSVSAQETQPAEIKRIALEKGKRAPFSGQLLSHAAVARLLAERQAEVAGLKLEIENLKKKHVADSTAFAQSCKIKMEAEKRLAKLCQESAAAKLAVYDTALKRTVKQCETKWYKSPYFNFVLGAVTFGGLAGGITYATNR
jgi:hypothetical protein